jgi:hypothetical protein
MPGPFDPRREGQLDSIRPGEPGIKGRRRCSVMSYAGQVLANNLVSAEAIAVSIPVGDGAMAGDLGISAPASQTRPVQEGKLRS